MSVCVGGCEWGEMTRQQETRRRVKQQEELLTQFEFHLIVFISVSGVVLSILWKQSDTDNCADEVKQTRSSPPVKNPLVSVNSYVEQNICT